jgi:outer membrane lipoprotein-sorting protein
MAKVGERNRGEDYIATVAWTLTKKGRVQQRATYAEKRKNYGGKDGFTYKSVIRYSEPSKMHKKSLLTWTYTNGKRDYWYFFFGFRDAQRTFSLRRYKSQAEVDFPLEDYVDIPLVTESYRLLSTEEFEDTTCYVIESTPLKEEAVYGKRVSYIDQQNLIPLKVNYFDKKGVLWKVLSITWQNISGVWFWKKAVANNVQEDYSTYIIIEKVKFNSDIHEREFTKIALERSRE